MGSIIKKKTDFRNRQVDTNLLATWRLAQKNLECFLDEVDAKRDAYSVVTWIAPQEILSPKAWGNYLLDKVPGQEYWMTATIAAENGKKFGFALPVNRIEPKDPLDFLLIDTYSSTAAWWLMNAWRSRELATATANMADNSNTVAAAACARALIETAASMWDDSSRLAKAWNELKTGGAPSLNHDFLAKWKAIKVLLNELHHGAKFNDRNPDKKTAWTVPRTNVLTQLEKLGKAGLASLQADYQWLCNTVHPSVGNKLAYSSPPLGHDTKTHIIQYYCGSSAYVEKSDGSVVEEQTVGFATARCVIVALRVLLLSLDAALRTLDDIGLTSGAPLLSRERCWRKLPALGKNDLCPCRSGLKVKLCGHTWGKSAPEIPKNLKHLNLAPET